MITWATTATERHWGTTAVVVALAVFQLVVVARVIMRRLPVGESLAWVFVVSVFPMAGPLIYLLLGELRIGSRRAQRVRDLFQPIDSWHQSLEHSRGTLDPTAGGTPFARLAEASFGVPPIGGGRLTLYDSWQAGFDAILQDIRAAKSSCHLEFYIWNSGGRADEVVEELIAAVGRGVRCRLLLDAIGSRDFLRGPVAERLRESGVELLEALPGGIFRALFVRFDLRMHRKIIIIDGRLAYTGSMNMVDPRFFKRDAGVGQWVDAITRIEGPPVEALAITFLADWYVESHESIETLRESGDVHRPPPAGDSLVQVVPSGPTGQPKAIERALVTAVYSAREEIILTTPYFVPDESLQTALVSASLRGVRVVLIVPLRVDSVLVRNASHAFMGELVEAGVVVAQFDDGLLHTKSVTVDAQWSLFGSLNLDPRSLHLNFELTLGIYDREFTRCLRNLQASYLERSIRLTSRRLASRSKPRLVAENLTRLLAPLL
jgi:cardiolipin synthase